MKHPSQPRDRLLRNFSPTLSTGASVTPGPLSTEPSLPPGNRSLLADLCDFIVAERAWWMAPIVVVLLLFAAFVLVAQVVPVGPFVYAM